MLSSHPITFFDSREVKARNQQIEIVNKVYENWDKYRYIMIAAPTGVGKTFITCSLAEKLSKRGYILTSTLQLQDQYEKSWDAIVNLKGRGNYTCRVNPNFMVDAAPCSANSELKSDCYARGVCEYKNQKDAALKSQAMITNPLFLLYSAHCGFAKDDPDQDEGYSNPWVQREALLIDEAHNIENHLVSFAESRIDPQKLAADHDVNLSSIRFKGELVHDYQELKKLKGLLDVKAAAYAEKMKTEFPTKGRDAHERAQWARAFNDKVAEKVKKLNSKIYALDKAIQPLNIFFNTHDSVEQLQARWLMHADTDENTLQLSPLTADFLFHEYFGELAEKFVFMSATLGTKSALCKELGIDEKDALYIEVDTPFPPEKSPIVVMPMLDLTFSRKKDSIPKIGPLIDHILNEHAGQRGIIHSATYEFGREVYNRVSDENRKRLLFRDMEQIDAGLTGKTAKYNWKPSNSELLRMHEAGERPHSVLVSPSMMEGVDLYDDLSEFQIILKMPWASLGDARVKRKMELDNEWYTNKVWVHVMQASGRSTRHEQDESVTYILDSTFPRSYKAWKKNLPSWFTKRVIIDEA